MQWPQLTVLAHKEEDSAKSISSNLYLDFCYYSLCKLLMILKLFPSMPGAGGCIFTGSLAGNLPRRVLRRNDVIGSLINFHLVEDYVLITAKTNFHLLLSYSGFLSVLLRLTWRVGWGLSHAGSHGDAKLSLCLVLILCAELVAQTMAGEMHGGIWVETKRTV